MGRCIKTLDWNPTQHPLSARPAQHRSSSRLADMFFTSVFSSVSCFFFLCSIGSITSRCSGKELAFLPLKFFSGRNVACENSRPSWLPARVNATRAGSEEGRLFSQARRNVDPTRESGGTQAYRKQSSVLYFEKKPQ